MKLVLLKCKQSILAREPILWLNIMLTSLTPSSTGSFNQAVLSLANIACRFAFSSQGKYFFAMARRDLKNYKIFYQSGFRHFFSLALFKKIIAEPSDLIWNNLSTCNWNMKLWRPTPIIFRSYTTSNGMAAHRIRCFCSLKQSHLNK